MKKIIAIVGFLGVAVLIGFVLIGNKEKMEAKSKGTTLKTDFPVLVETVSSGYLADELSIIGTIHANNDLMVISETSGKVLKMNFTEGQSISKNSIMAEIDDEIAQANLKMASANLEKAKKDYQRYQTLHSQGAIPEAQLDAAKLGFETADAQHIIAKRTVDNAKIKAPISGIVISKSIDNGHNVAMHAAIANIVDVSSVKIKLNVSEADVFKIKKGDIVEITSDAYPKTVFKGTINFISYKGDAAHTFPIEISVKNDDKLTLKAGMFAKVRFTSIKPNETVIIPRDAVLGGVKNANVFVVENGKAYNRKIVVGAENANKISVLSGLKAGEKLVVSGQSNLRNEFSVSVLNSQGN